MLLETIFLQLIKPFGQKELKYAIENDINLAELTQKYASWILNLMKAFIKVPENFDVNEFIEKFLEFMEKERYDLYLILKTKEGKNWLKKQINGFLKLL